MLNALALRGDALDALALPLRLAGASLARVEVREAQAATSDVCPTAEATRGVTRRVLIDSSDQERLSAMEAWLTLRAVTLLSHLDCMSLWLLCL